MSWSCVRAVTIGSLILILSLAPALPALAWQQDAPTANHQETWQPLDYLFGLIHELLYSGAQSSATPAETPTADEGWLDTGGDQPQTSEEGDGGPLVDPVG